MNPCISRVSTSRLCLKARPELFATRRHRPSRTAAFVLALLGLGLLSAGTRSLAANGFDEVLTFDDGLIPPGWALMVHKGGILNQRLQAEGVASSALLTKPKSLPETANEVQIIFRSQIREGTNGVSQVHLVGDGPIEFFFSVTATSPASVRVSAGLVSAPEYSQDIAGGIGPYIADVHFREGNITFTLSPQSGGTPLLSETVNVPLLAPAALSNIFFVVTQNSAFPGWIDNISITALPGDGEPAMASQLLNISTRANVGAGENVLIGGFIIAGTGAKRVVIRGIAPSLALTDSLPDPALELHESDGTTVTNDNWADNSAGDIALLMDKGLAPANAAESVIVATLNPGSYTVILHDAGIGAGIGLVEVYDIDPLIGSTTANLSTRGMVGTGDGVMIGGFIVGGSTVPAATVLVRALGPSLAGQGILNPLSDRRLDLYNSQGSAIASNDQWMSSVDAEVISDLGLAPPDLSEAALLLSPPVGAYTAIVSGADGGTGIGLVEVYDVTMP